jgi:ABC-type transport system involved in multi-copper enzyme maturation permease subunit
MRMANNAIATSALVRDTFREAFARKIFWGFFGCSTAVILFFLFLMKIDVVEGALATVSLFGKESRATDVTLIVRSVQGALAAFLYGFGLFLAVFASSGLIPTIFEPGRIELLLSKPVGRHHILLGRYLGNVLVIAFNMLYLVVSVWLILGIKTHIWTYQFLYSTGLTIFVFAVLLTIVLLISVLWESAVLATMVTFGVMIIGLIVAQKSLLERLLTSEWSRNVVRGLYYALPKVMDLGNIGRKLTMGTPVDDWMPLWSTALFGVAMLSISLVVFARKNY